ncbi:MAG TPA: HD domain-containing phosphohydrolase [Vicinamibacterales bacterium]|jgi:putative nucleotidyltransferase with HDIG domain|nr:HD domain-containing phosphohydrolase [Vicinamibacterales bacterium]
MPLDDRARDLPVPLVAFIVAVVAAGAVVLADSASLLHASSFNVYAVLLAVLTMASGRFAIKVPGRPATVSVSEVFVFASVLLFGPAVPTLTVAIDGLWISLTQKHRRLHRALFNIAEPALSTWAAAHVFFAITHMSPGSSLSTNTPLVVPATIAMVGVFFALNSGLSAMAVAIENGTSAYEFWRGHAWYLAINYYAAASLAALAVSSGPRINFGVVGLVAPLLILSYVAYREASTRIDDAHRHVVDIENLYRASVEMLAIAVDAKDQVTHGHIRRVQRHTLAVAAALGVTDPRELKAIEAGALLHDIGKLAVPDYVLNKPSALTRSEFETMKKHASMGARILTAVDFPYPIVPIVRHHHEQWDGGGYPDGLIGAETPLGARILAVVDCFDALTSDRPYRPKLSDERAIETVRSRKATFYDPVVVEKFIELIPELRRDDAASTALGDAHSSVVAGLARATSRGRRESDTRDVSPASTALLPAARDFIDEQIAGLGTADACLFAFNAVQDALIVVHATPRVRRAVTPLQIPVGSGVSGWVAANRSSIRRADAVLDVGDMAHAYALQSCVSVPVFVGADLFGVLTVYVADNGISDDRIAAVGLLAQEVGLLIARRAAPVTPSQVPPARRLSIAAVS